MAKRKKKEMIQDVELFETTEEEIVEMEAEEVIEEPIEEPEKACNGKVLVMITDQFVKLEGKIYPRYTQLEICKKLAAKAKRCKVL